MGRQYQITGEEKARVILIQLHTIKPLINKDNYMKGYTYLSILTLNVNELNSPIKGH
jgi:hypothetical protein